MANSALKDQFFALMRSSRSFQLLKPEEQVSLQESFENATDEQYQRGIAELQRDKAEMERLEAEREKRSEEQAKVARNLQQTLKDLGKEELASNVAKDKQKSEAKAEELLGQIEQLVDEDEKKAKKRKKFLGIF